MCEKTHGQIIHTYDHRALYHTIFIVIFILKYTGVIVPVVIEKYTLNEPILSQQNRYRPSLRYFVRMDHNSMDSKPKRATAW